MREFRETYMGAELYLSQDQCDFLSTMAIYRERAKKDTAAFMEKFHACQDMIEFAQKGLPAAEQLFKEYVAELIEMLPKMGVYGIGEAYIAQHHGEYMLREWCMVEELVEDFCQQCNEAVEEAALYRELRKAGRGRMVGGGFGLSGAIKGMAKAGALNAASGVAHSVANAIGNSMTRASYRAKAREAFRSMEFETMVQESLELCLQRVGIVKLLCLNYDINSIGMGSDSQRQQAASLRSSFTAATEKRKGSIAVKMLTLDPAGIENYRFLLENGSDPGGTLEKLARLAGIHDAFQAEVNRQMDECCIKELLETWRSIAALQFEDLQTKRLSEIRKAARNIVVQEGKRYGQKSTSPAVVGCMQRVERTIQKRVDELEAEERRQRTFQGILFDSQDDFRKAKEIWSKVEALMADAGGKDAVGLQQDIAMAKQLEQEAPEKLKSKIQACIQELDEAWKKVDTKERTYMGKVFTTREDLHRAKQDYEALCQTCPLESLTNSKGFRAAKAALTRPGLHPAAVDFYTAGYEKAMIVFKNNKLINAGIVSSVVVLLILLFVPMLRIGGRAVNSFDMLFVVLINGDTGGFTTNMRIAAGAFLLLIDVVYFVAFFHTWRESGIKTAANWSNLAAVGVFLLIALGVCWLMDSVDSTLAMRLLTFILLIGGGFAISKSKSLCDSLS